MAGRYLFRLARKTFGSQTDMSIESSPLKTIRDLPLHLFIPIVELFLLTYMLAYDPSTRKRATWADVLR